MNNKNSTSLNLERELLSMMSVVSK